MGTLPVLRITPWDEDEDVSVCCFKGIPKHARPAPSTQALAVQKLDGQPALSTNQHAQLDGRNGSDMSRRS